MTDSGQSVVRPRCACGEEHCEHLTDDQARDFYSGVYDAARVILARPFDALPLAMEAKRRLVALGVVFDGFGEQR